MAVKPDVRALTLDDYGGDRAVRAALSSRLDRCLENIAMLGRVLGMMEIALQSRGDVGFDCIEGLMACERAFAAEIRADAAFLAELLIATLRARGDERLTFWTMRLRASRGRVRGMPRHAPLWPTRATLLVSLRSGRLSSDSLPTASRWRCPRSTSSWMPIMWI